MSPRSLKRSNIFASFGYAIRGLFYTFFTQRNMWIHSGLGFLALIGGIYFHFSRIEWCLLVFSVSFVLVCETINTAIEISVDLTTKKRRFRAMLSKDVAAGAVFLSALNSMAIGYLLFYDRLVNLIKEL